MICSRDEHLIRVVAGVLDDFRDLQVDRRAEDATALRIELYLQLRHHTVYPEGKVLELMSAAAGRVGLPLSPEAAQQIARLVWEDTRWGTGRTVYMSEYFRRVREHECAEGSGRKAKP